MLLARIGLCLCFLGASCFATQILLSPADVIGGSGAYGGNWQTGSFNATEILDQQTGNVVDSFGTTYWLNPDNGPANAYIVIDLGAAYHIVSIDLFNTHNSGFGDRGTGNFTFEASNAITNLGGPGFDLSGPTTTILNGTLAAAPVADPIAAQSFAVSDPGSYRYFKFEPNSVATSGASCCGANNYGLNELRVFDAPASGVPEPASFLLVAGGIALTALRCFPVARRSQRSASESAREARKNT